MKRKQMELQNSIEMYLRFINESIYDLNLVGLYKLNKKLENIYINDIPKRYAKKEDKNVNN